MKLTSICIGPFEVNPESGRGMKVDVKLYSFCEANLLEHAFLDQANRDQRQASGKNFQPVHFTQRAVYDTVNGKYYFLVMLSSLLLVEEDICIKIKSVQTPNQIEPFKFRFWLHAKYVKNQVGKINKTEVSSNVRRNQFICIKELIDLEDREDITELQHTPTVQ